MYQLRDGPVERLHCSNRVLWQRFDVAALCPLNCVCPDPPRHNNCVGALERPPVVRWWRVDHPESRTGTRRLCVAGRRSPGGPAAACCTALPGRGRPRAGWAARRWSTGRKWPISNSCRLGGHTRVSALVAAAVQLCRADHVKD